MGAGYSEYENECENECDSGSDYYGSDYYGGGGVAVASQPPPTPPPPPYIQGQLEEDYAVRTKMLPRTGTLRAHLTEAIGVLLVYDGFRAKIQPDYRIFPEAFTLQQFTKENLYEISWTNLDVENWDKLDEYLDDWRDFVSGDLKAGAELDTVVNWWIAGLSFRGNAARKAFERVRGYTAQILRNNMLLADAPLLRVYFALFFHVLLVTIRRGDQLVAREFPITGIFPDLLQTLGELSPAEAIVLFEQMTLLIGADVSDDFPAKAGFNLERFRDIPPSPLREELYRQTTRLMFEESNTRAQLAISLWNGNVDRDTGAKDKGTFFLGPLRNDAQWAPVQGFELNWENFRIDVNTILNRYLYDDRMIFVADRNFAIPRGPGSYGSSATTHFLTWETTRSITAFTALHLARLQITLQWITDNLDEVRKHLARILSSETVVAMIVEASMLGRAISIGDDVSAMWKEGTDEWRVLQDWRANGSPRITAWIVALYNNDPGREDDANSKLFLKLFRASRSLPEGATIFVGANQKLVDALGGHDRLDKDTSFEVYAPIAATVSPDIAIKFAINGHTHRILILEVGPGKKNVKAMDMNPFALYEPLKKGTMGMTSFVMEFELVLQPALRYTLVEDGYYWLDSVDAKQFEGDDRGYSPPRKFRVQKWRISQLEEGGGFVIPGEHKRGGGGDGGDDGGNGEQGHRSKRSKTN